MFRLLVLLALLACAAALWSQSPAFDPLDVWALPLLATILLGLQVLLAAGKIHVRTAFNGAFLVVSVYVLLALDHQFRVLPPGALSLSENTYWFAVIYTAAFVTYPTGRALQVVGIVLAAAVVICVGHLLYTVPAQTRMSLTGASLQFLLTGTVLIVIQATLGAQRVRLLAARAAAYTDPLTGLANRRAAEERLWALSRTAATYTVVLFDLDHFKRINDTHGHATGDLVLRGVADTVRAHLPEGAVAARWGGEEFLMILPPLTEQEARSTLNVLRNKLREQRHGEVMGVTACFGVATAQPGEHPDRAVARADQAMYAAKQQGRNDIRLAEWRHTQVPVNLEPAPLGGEPGES
ncbi:GGDEF domain-containing protein [Deinococcus aerophilus]|uniref:GGDEF domain-containing protein n=1 Tax=Deinococcus aerophilus TaxID=522488 RepID=A0ABQ2GPK9_9DEIO|nr:GGDEF domain-containing protein [Deinococcus aerophilus]GGM04953.1 GGDEF domain-containing protein [Deinococcus aerophilus]